MLNRKNIRIYLIALSLFFFSPEGFSEVIDKIVAIVNDEVITQREVARKIMPLFEQYRTMYEGAELNRKIDEAYKMALEQMINDKLIVSEAKQKGIEVSEEEIEYELEKIKKNFASEEEFYLTLDNQGITLQELKKNYKSQLMARTLVETEIASKVSVSPSEIAEFYEKNKDQFIKPESVRLKSITIKITEDRSSKEALKFAEDLLKRIKKGEDFAELAITYSDDTSSGAGGDMGYVKKGDMIKRIDDIIFSLNVGEVSNVIRSDLGFHIFKVEEKKDPENITLNDSREDIERIIFNQKVEKKLTDYIVELRENAYISYK